MTKRPVGKESFGRRRKESRATCRNPFTHGPTCQHLDVGVCLERLDTCPIGGMDVGREHGACRCRGERLARRADEAVEAVTFHREHQPRIGAELTGARRQ